MAIEATTYEPKGTRAGRLGRVYYGWYVLFGMVIALLVAEGATFGSFGAYVQPLERQFGWSRAEVSLGFSVVVGTVGLLAPIIGRLIDVVGPRRLMLIGAPLAMLSMALLAFMTQLWQWYAYLALNAAALGLIAYMPAQALAVRWFDRQRAVAVSVIGASVWLGQLIMLPLTQTIISRLGWGDAFLWSGFMVLGAYAVAFVLVRDRPGPDSGTESQRPRQTQTTAVSNEISGVTPRVAIRTPLFWALVLGLMLFYFVVFGWLSQAVPIYQSLDYSDATAALIVSLTAGGAVVWILTAGGQLERFRRPERAAALCTVCICGSMAVLWASGGTTWGVAVQVVLYVLGFAAAPSLEALMISRGFGLAHFATIMGTAFTFQTMAIMFSPWVAGRIYDASGSYDGALVMYAICAGASCVVFLVASRIRQPLATRLSER